MDEPHAKLDREGEATLNAAIRSAQPGSAIRVLIVHRPSAFARCGKVLVPANGRRYVCGPSVGRLPTVTPQVV